MDGNSYTLVTWVEHKLTGGINTPRPPQPRMRGPGTSE